MATENNLPDKIRQGNPITEGRLKFSRTEKNIYYIVVGRVRKEYIERDMFDGHYNNLKVFVPDSSLKKAADEDHTQRARSALRSLRHKDIEIEDKETGEWLNVGFINYAHYLPSKKGYEVEVSDQIMPYLVELSKNYTEYEIAVAISLQSKWSKEFYELCSQYKSYQGGFFFKTVAQLRKMLDLEDKYPKVPLFEKYTIAVAYAELKDLYTKGQCDLWFDYKKEGRGEGATYKFYIHTRDNEKQQQEAFKDMHDKAIAVYRALKIIFKRDPKFCDRVLKDMELRPDIVTPVYEKIAKIMGTYKKGEVAPVIRYALREDFQLK